MKLACARPRRDEAAFAVPAAQSSQAWPTDTESHGRPVGCQPYEGNISFARAINSVCYARSHTPAAQRFPTGGVLYRGGGMDDMHRGFFVEGK